MFGLMGTLIPLGPGIVALGNGDTATLAASIGVAFNTTVAGLIVAAVCIIISKLRRNWYDDYIVALETAMTTLIEKIEDDEYEAGYDGYRDGIAAPTGAQPAYVPMGSSPLRGGEAGRA